MDAETIKIIIGLGTLVIGSFTLSFTLNRYMFGRRIDDIFRQISESETDNKEEHKRLDDERKDCRGHCEDCRDKCQHDNKEDFQRLHERIDNAG